MESIDRMRARHRKTEEDGTIRHPLTDEPMELGEHEHTLAEIFADKREHDIFVNHYLPTIETGKIKATDLADALVNGRQLTPAEDTFLEKARMSYNFLRASSDRVKESLTDGETLERIAEADPRVREIIGKIGGEKAASLLSSKLDELAASDPKGFKRLVDNARAAKTLRESRRAQGVESDLALILGRYKIPEEKYFDAVEASMGTRGGHVSLETRTKLGELAREQLGLFGKTVDFITRGAVSSARGQEMERVFDKQRTLMKEYDKHFAVVGAVLRGTLNPDMKLAMQNFMLQGGELMTKDERTVLTLQDYKTVREQHTPEARKKRLKAFAKAEALKLNKDLNALDATEKDDIKNRFVDEEEKKQKSHKGGGLMAALLTFLFSVNTKAALKSEADTIWQ